MPDAQDPRNSRARLESSDRAAAQPGFRAATISRRVALGGAGAGLAAALLAACGGSGSPQQTGTGTTTTAATASIFGTQPTFRFTVVNHATQSAVYTPTQNGVADACSLLDASYQWVGSQTGDVTEMLSSINIAISARVDGIATTLIDPTAFNAPVSAALAAGIPVIAYNSDVSGNARLAYVGTDPYSSGRQMGVRIRALLPNGGRIAVFVSAPGTANLKPRVRGIRAELRGSGIKADVVASGASASEQAQTISKFITLHDGYQGLVAVDGSSTAALATAIQSANLNAKHVVGGGYDLTPITQQLLASGVIDFAVDEQLYLQGFLPILQLYLHRVSAGLTGPADVNTGARLIDKHGAAAYVHSQSRFEGTSSSAGLQSA